METPHLCWSEVWVAQDLQVAFEVGTILREWAPNLWDLCSFWILVSVGVEVSEHGLFGIGKHTGDGDFK